MCSMSKSVKSTVTSELALLDLDKCKDLKLEFADDQLLRNYPADRKAL